MYMHQRIHTSACHSILIQAAAPHKKSSLTPQRNGKTGPILGGVMYEKLPRRPEISCKVGGDVEDCSSGAAWTCFAFALVLVPVVGACVRLCE